MRRLIQPLTGLLLSGFAVLVPAATALAQNSAQKIDLADRLTSKGLRAVNREVTALSGDKPGVRVSEKEGPGVVWIEGSEFGLGTIEVDVRGRDVPQASFVGIAFHRKDDSTYEGVYLRPFNFRNPDEARRQNAVQYIAVPNYDWPRLRKEFPSEFENPVDASVSPTDWVQLRVVVKAKTVEIYVGTGSAPALEVRRLAATDSGAIGLWVGNNSNGDFANLRITPAK
jgi:hypothetical protein